LALNQLAQRIEVQRVVVGQEHPYRGRPLHPGERTPSR
jgi:hypothetical protein